VSEPEPSDLELGEELDEWIAAGLEAAQAFLDKWLAFYAYCDEE
jgi:hypothetical protein